MKKGIALLLTLLLVLGLAACGDEPAAQTDAPKPTEAPTAESSATAETTAGPEFTTEPTTEPTHEPTTELAAEPIPVAALPEVFGVNHEMPFHLDGYDFTVNSYNEPVVRLWFTITNATDSIKYPEYLAAWSGITLTQNDATLARSSTKEQRLEDTLAGQDFYPGVTVQFAVCYTVENETDPISVTIVTDDGENVSFELDPSVLAPAIPEPCVWEPVTDPAWVTFASDTYANPNGITERLVGYEVVDGTPWVGTEEVRVIRIISEFTSEADSENSISSYFTPMQDGVELALGVPNEKVDTDITLSTKIQPGGTLTVSSCYVLYNNDPVFALAVEGDTAYGAFFTVE